MVVVNTKENLKKNIMYVELKKIPPTLLALFEVFSAPGKNMGVKSNNYYLFNLDAVFHTPKQSRDKTFRIFQWIIHRAASLSFTDVMFVLP